MYTRYLIGGAVLCKRQLLQRLLLYFFIVFNSSLSFSFFSSCKLSLLVHDFGLAERERFHHNIARTSEIHI